MEIKGYEICLNPDNSINKFSPERISSKTEITIEGKFYKNYLYINDVVKKRGISSEKQLYWCDTSSNNDGSGFHFKPKNLGERIKFLWYYKKIWIQDKDNVMWVVNITVAILAIIMASRNV